MSLGYGGSTGIGGGIETRKIFCAYHKTQFLTNFCIEKQCLMPLCPTCIVQHTEEHFQKSQKPTYVNLNEALQEVKQNCYSHIVSLEEYGKKNDQLAKYRQTLSTNVHQQLSDLKHELYTKIQLLFQKYEVKLLKNIEQTFFDNAVYDMKEAENISQYITENIEILYDKIGVLKSQQCLGALIRFYDHEGQGFQESLKTVQGYIEKHKRAGRPELVLNKEVVERKFENLCEEVINLSYNQTEEHMKPPKATPSNKDIYRFRPPHENTIRNYNMF